MKSRIAIGGAVAAWLAMWLSGAVSAQLEEGPPSKKFMREKLAASQSVLEGVVTEDYDLIAQGAAKMLAMSKATEWHVIQGPVYAQYSAEFRRNTEALLEAAKDKNLEGANVRYISVQLSCIGCHKYVRSTQVAHDAAPGDTRVATGPTAADRAAPRATPP